MNATPAILQLTDSLPRVWRSPDELQFGLDRPALVLRHVTNLEERLIAALDAGVTRAGLTMLARRAGGKDAQVTELLERLRPVLGRPPRPSGPPRPGNVAVAGGGPVGDLVAHL
ncbi:MAG TPA: hypothetical protein VFQ96_04015, partial [Microbacteriaceae bacterium]|nr:hypothetical protein [Microbacteriaceae bacterium]